VEAAFGDNYANAVSSFVDASLKYRVVNIAPRLVIETLGVAGMVGTLLLLAASGRGLAEMLPVLALFAMVAVRVMPSITRIISSMTAIRHFRPALSIVHDDLANLGVPSRPPAEPATEAGPVESVELRGVSFRYPDTDSDTLSDVELTLRRGDRVGFVGASGCGKTTAVDVMLGLLEPEAGSVLVDGEDIADEGVRRGWQRKIGYIAQPTYIMDETIRTNIAFGVRPDEIDDDTVWRALRAAQLDDFVADLPDGLATRLGEGGARLSGGQRQRIGIARALYHDPQVIILDEATSALDNETDRGVRRAIEALGEDKILVVISHRPATIRNCDRLYFMQEGTVVDVGTFDELAERSDAFRRMVQAES
jgi:ATP-binding cassette subfamily C protein